MTAESRVARMISTRAIFLVLALLIVGVSALTGSGSEGPTTDETASTMPSVTTAPQNTDSGGSTEPTRTAATGPGTTAQDALAELPQPVQSRHQQLLGLAEAKDYAGLAEISDQTATGSTLWPAISRT